MIVCSKLTSSARRVLVVGVMVAALSAGLAARTASAEVALVPGTPAAWAAGSDVILAGKCMPPKKKEGCVKDQCTGKYVCCTKTSGGLSCTTMEPKKK